MTSLDIARRRLCSVGLTGPVAVDLAEVVGRLGAVQAQDYGPTKWSLGQRCVGLDDVGIDVAFDAGAILRTHVLRSTWHFVRPVDIRWMQELTAPRVHAFNAYYYRQLGLDDALLRRCGDLISAALVGGGALTRKEIATMLERAGIPATGMRLGYILMHAELSALICSGPRSGKQHTYALLDERAAGVAAPERDEALAELTVRYFTSHGPATVRDFAWWSSLTIAEIRRGLDLVRGRLESDTVDDITYWYAASPAVPSQQPPPSPTVLLLWGYDEYIVGYSESKYALDLSGVARLGTPDRPAFNGVVVLDSQVAGCWRRTVSKHSVVIEATLYVEFDDAQREALHAAASRHGAFLGLPSSVVTTSG
ncbi:MAG TPA: winged helix DNA-binding domain-containing protein [Micromonosporaceae bacterium]|nr:winged helix DNA-binding domain-containing protein [Micromonosporaceae bacterium]